MSRPIFASSVSFCPDTSLPHFGQCNAPSPIVFPQPRQRFSRRGVGTAGGAVVGALAGGGKGAAVGAAAGAGGGYLYDKHKKKKGQ